ncbi:uncharacterized protein BDW43DRAFT_153796 [Aspergillus alliaceus]|uniref:uncharacterized protein n=1 Tax=Petromyces alliaceus TaxID=209559 RepID=UPI0012A3BFE8|nr:uncharacterized protein BDW43DRAFT_153796 [Aspergillus alliaceus]KAB8238185.1 hypothetical protein BDW43DRAFT_153796 [Aspergillus alliaceus]
MVYVILRFGCFLSLFSPLNRSRHGWPELLCCFEKRKRRLSAWAQATVSCGHSSQKFKGSRRSFSSAEQQPPFLTLRSRSTLPLKLCTKPLFGLAWSPFRFFFFLLLSFLFLFFLISFLFYFYFLHPPLSLVFLLKKKKNFF